MKDAIRSRDTEIINKEHNMKLTQFKITKLHGQQDYTLKFTDNRLIIVGENGAGKTTVLRMCFLFLSGQWYDLLQYNFNSVSVRLNRQSITITKEELKNENHIRQLDNIGRRPSIGREIQRIAQRIALGEEIDGDEIESMSDRYGISRHRLLNEILNLKDRHLRKKMTKQDEQLEVLQSYLSTCHILYLPTYRRIEQELCNIFDYPDLNEFRRHQRMMHQRHNNQFHTELVEFGMDDVKKTKDKKLEDLKEFTRAKLNALTLGYLRDVVDGIYDTVNVEEIKNVGDEMIENILKRISKDILDETSKEKLKKTIQNMKNNTENTDMHQKIVCHYFSKLLNFQQELETEEKSIREFCNICNLYMTDKQFEYVSSSFELNLFKKEGKNEIELNQLSSGEKQIVSLFSHLYLSTNRNFFVLIDEPELSLSVQWQEKFLQDISKSDLCSGFLAVTHSPFIYDNDLEKYAHGINEFIKEVN